jgi:16S rRNA (guanine1207-N2)-methyltransferase
LKGAGHSAPFVLEQTLEEQAIKTLFLPFETGELPVPSEQHRWLFLNATVPAPSDLDLRSKLICVQDFRPEHISLLKAGYKALPELDAGENFSGALILLGKHRNENRRNISLALTRTLEGTPVLVAGSRTLGIESIRREVAARLPIEASWSKHHAQVFQFACPAEWPSAPDDHSTSVEVDNFIFRTAPGMFSSKAVDAGSASLIPHLGLLKGSVADFGAGWGYLSLMALRGSPGIESIHLYEAGHSSIRAAEENLGTIESKIPIHFHWSDLAQEPPALKFDTVIMNPPFHNGRRVEPDIGRRFIELAAGSLKPGGQLLMVANRQLPYEATLQGAFRKFDRISEDRLYKVIRAVR